MFQFLYFIIRPKMDPCSCMCQIYEIFSLWKHFFLSCIIPWQSWVVARLKKLTSHFMDKGTKAQRSEVTWSAFLELVNGRAGPLSSWTCCMLSDFLTFCHQLAEFQFYWHLTWIFLFLPVYIYIFLPIHLLILTQYRAFAWAEALDSHLL